ncbi:LPS-assembly lipoprotein LptE [Aquabacterium parvum]|uniref:LPS-assembly lipoprotein LptE n=1 Tax=Aquabacterium parvum TaxID=70584 RepID=UPI00128EFB9D|nr:LPS assembly lipoprotein LptE [Aquabacterium parvum]
MQRRQLLTLLGASSLLPLATLGGCGFQLRRQHDMAFRSIQLSGFIGTSPLATELARALDASGVTVVESTLQATQAASAAKVPVTHVEFVALQDTRDSLVSAKTAFGQVRTMTARSILRFEVRRGDGSVLLPASDVALVRDLSYNERDALAKQDESEALTRAMQTDIVNQVMRRLAAIKPQQLPTPPEANKATGGAAR